MNKETLKALKGSIEKWENIVDGKDVDNATEDCPLCQLFWDEDCESCPVCKKTGRNECSNTPYVKWRLHHIEKHYGYTPLRNECPECKEIAIEELNFLKSLLPKTKTKK